MCNNLSDAYKCDYYMIWAQSKHTQKCSSERLLGELEAI